MPQLVSGTHVEFWCNDPLLDEMIERERHKESSD